MRKDRQGERRQRRMLNLEHNKHKLRDNNKVRQAEVECVKCGCCNRWSEHGTRLYHLGRQSKQMLLSRLLSTASMGRCQAV